MHCSPKKGTDGLTDTDGARDGNAINEASISGQKSDRRKKGRKEGWKTGMGEGEKPRDRRSQPVSQSEHATGTGNNICVSVSVLNAG